MALSNEIQNLKTQRYNSQIESMITDDDNDIQTINQHQSWNNQLSQNPTLSSYNSPSNK